MADGNTLHIINHFDFPITVYVSANEWNCCDAPQQNQPVGYVEAGGQVDLGYCRKDGHGCDGRQGQFQLAMNINRTVDLNFDSGGGMSPPGATSGCQVALSSNADGTFTLIVYAG